MEKFFKLGDRHTNVKVEIIAGLTTFMTMAYVLAVQPSAICGSSSLTQTALSSPSPLS